MPVRYVLLFLGVFACSTAAIQIKASATHPVVLGALRLAIASLLLAPVAWRDARLHAAVFNASYRRRTVLPAVVLAAHFITWGYGVRLTLAVQATLIVNLVPVAIPFFLHALVGEKIKRVEIVGTALALVGVVVLSAPGLMAGGGGGGLAGNAVCFVSMLFFAWYLALGRRNRDFPSLWLYVVPVYAQAAAICFVVSLPWLGTFEAGSAHEWALMLGLAVIPTIVGHSLLNASMRQLRGQIVSLANVGQFLFAGAMAWLFFGEVPDAAFYGASALVVAGVVVVVLAAPPQPRLR